ncbi:MAG: helix-turn-helix domain-containing protein [Myxococcota bacterium]|nr:helix-turn-helix domain-containing protein [Myxococcota bacterium]
MSEIRETRSVAEPPDIKGEESGSGDSGRAQGSIGAYLKSQRELRGISMEELAALTRIPMRSLERLEAGRFDDQPDGFVRGFVRTVGIGLGLDPDAAVARMLSEPASEERRGFRFAHRSPRAVIGLALIIALVLGVLSVRAWSQRRALPRPIERGEVIQRQDPVRALADAQAALGSDSSASKSE